MTTKQTQQNLKTEVVDLLNGTPRSILVDEFFDSAFEQEINAQWDSEEDKEFKQKLTEAEITVEFVDNYGGEDMGSSYWSVYKFQRGTEEVLVKFVGWYQSFDGSEYEEFFVAEAKPVQTFKYVKV